MRVHPILFSEWYQTRRSLWKTLLFTCACAAALRYLGMKELIWFILLPNIASGVGIGTFSEEYQKGQLKFLFSLPVKRFQIWIIKILFGIAGAFLFLACIYVIWAIVPGKESDSSWFIWSEVLELGPGGLILLVSAISLYSFFSGHLSISLCSNQRIAGFLNQFLIYNPIVALFLLSTQYQYVPTGPQLVVLYSLISVPCVAGGLILFLNRSPFMEQKWKWRGIGTATIVVVSLTLGSFLYFADQLLPPRLPDYGEKVTSFAVSPDGKKVFVTATRRMHMNYSFVMDDEGRLLRDFGAGQFHGTQSEITWQNREPYSTVLVQEMREMNEEDGSSLYFFAALGIDDGSRSEFPMLMDTTRARFFNYSAWVPNSDTLAGMVMDQAGRTPRSSLFLQNVTTGDVITEKRTVGDEAAYAEILRSGYLVVSRSAPFPSVSRTDLNTMEQISVSLSADVAGQSVSPDGRNILFTRRILSDSGVYHEVWMRGFDTEDSVVVIDSSVLPTGTLELAAAGRMGDCFASFLGQGNWVRCQASPNALVTHNWLLNPFTGEKVSLDQQEEGAAFSQPQFSPNGESFFTLEPDGAQDARAAFYGGSELGMKFKLYRIENGNVSLLLERSLGQVQEIKWFGETKLLYLARVDTRPEFYMGQQLRVMDLKNGIDRPFFAGNPSPSQRFELEARVLSTGEEDLVPTRRPYLWEINGSAPSFIFGTVGLPFAAVNELHSAVDEKMALSDRIYTEISFDQETMETMTQRYKLPPGRMLADIVPEPVMQKVRAYFDTKGVSLELFSALGPMFISDLIPQLEYMGRIAELKTMDVRFYERAKMDGRWGGGLVSVDSYLAFLDVLTEHEQAELLRMNVEENLLASASGRNPSLEIAKIYLTGDEAAFRKRGLSCIEPESEIFKKYVFVIHSENNRLIARRIAELIRKAPGKKHFFAIQGVRLSGEDGVLRMLEEAGLKLKRIVPEGGR